MKRFCQLSVFAVLGAMLAGCGGGGLEEGIAAPPSTSGQSDVFKANMEKNAAKMKMKKPAAAATKTPAS